MFYAPIRRRLLACAAGLAVLSAWLALPRAAAAGLTYDRATAAVSASANDGKLTQAAAAEGPPFPLPPVSATAAGGDANTISSGSASARLALSRNGFGGSVAMDLDSRVRPTAPPDMFFDPGRVLTDAEVVVVFTIDQLHRLDWAFNAVSRAVPETGGPDLEISLKLERLLRPGEVPDADPRVFGPRTSGEFPFTGTALLPAGTYEFEFLEIGGTVPSASVGGRTVTFGLGLTPAVPLPPAAWTGLLTLGAIGLVHARRRWAARAGA